jgi:hypothetical protein
VWCVIFATAKPLKVKMPPNIKSQVAQDGAILTESQLAALDKAKSEKKAHGEFQSEHPGYCGAQDTFTSAT